jgi:predicted secreted Zn-dependent protease
MVLSRYRWACLALAACVPAFAQVQVCKDAQGHKVFSDMPCGPDAKLLDVKSASGSLAINPNVRIKVEYYDIRGTSWDALRHEIDAKGPEGWWGQAHSGTSYQIRTRPVDGGCGPWDVQVTADARVRLPSWVNRFDGPRSLQDSWDGVIRTLDLHERGHVQINLEGTREIERALKTIPVEPTCDAVIAEARRRFEEIRADVARRQIDYDADTEHGRRQWTPYH